MFTRSLVKNIHFTEAYDWKYSYFNPSICISIIFRSKGKSIRKKIRQSIRRKSTRRKKLDDNAASLAAAALAAAEKAEKEVEAVDISILESTTRERSQRRSGSSTSRKSKTSTVKFAVEGELENLIISEHQDVVDKRNASSSSNVFLTPEVPNSLETG